MAPAQIDLKKFVGEHVKYEIDMLRSTHECLRSRSWDWAVQNALIESFWIHARNLLEFFGKQKNAHPVTSFCETSYAPLKFSSVRPLYRKICEQISHLKCGRTHDVTAKLDVVNSGVRELLENEIERFRSHLCPECEDLISARSIPKPEPAAVLFTGPTRTTTTAASTSYTIGPTKL